jgi:MFS family permease
LLAADVLHTLQPSPLGGIEGQFEMADGVSTSRSPGGIFYGWFVVLAAFFAFGIVFGTVTYSFTVFVNPIATAFDTTPTKVLLAFTLTNIGTGVFGIFAGRLLTRYGIRTAVMLGLGIMAAGFFGLSMVTALWQVYLLYGLVVAFGAIIVAPLGASALVTNWFSASRGRALTLATLGTSFGQLVLPRVAASVIDGYDWQTAYQVFAVALIVAMPIIYVLVVDRPEDKGLEPYGGAAAATESAGPPVALTSGEILRNRAFWTIGLSYALTVTVYLALVGVMVPYARTFGVTALEASSVIVCMGVFAILGKILFATFTDRMGLRNTFWIAIGLNLVACILLVSLPQYAMLFVAAAMVGASAGGVLPLWPGMVAHRFGRSALPRVMGMMSPMVLIVQGFGAPLATALNYRPAFLLFIAMLVASAIISRGIDKRPLS